MYLLIKFIDYLLIFPSNIQYWLIIISITMYWLLSLLIYWLMDFSFQYWFFIIFIVMYWLLNLLIYWLMDFSFQYWLFIILIMYWLLNSLIYCSLIFRSNIDWLIKFFIIIYWFLNFAIILDFSLPTSTLLLIIDYWSISPNPNLWNSQIFPIIFKTLFFLLFNPKNPLKKAPKIPISPPEKLID